MPMLAPLLAPLLAALLPLQSDREPVTWRHIAEDEHPITSLVGSADGKLLITASRTGIRAFDLRREKVSWTVGIHAPMPVPDALFGGDEHVGYCLEGTGIANLVSLEDGSRVGSPGAGDPLDGASALVLTRKGQYVWTGTQAGKLVRVTRSSANAWSVRSLGNGGVTCLALDGKGKLLAAGGQDKSIRFAGAKSATVDEERILECDDVVTALTFGPRSKLLFSGTSSGEVLAWKLSKDKTALQFEGLESGITALAVHPKGKWLAAGDESGRVLLFELKKGERIYTLDEREGEPIVGIVVLDGGKTLATACGGESITLWDLTRL